MAVETTSPYPGTYYDNNDQKFHNDDGSLHQPEPSGETKNADGDSGEAEEKAADGDSGKAEDKVDSKTGEAAD